VIPWRVPSSGTDVRVGHPGCICAEWFDVTGLPALDILINDYGMDQMKASRLLWVPDRWSVAS